jgi:hypothetical protein
LSAPKAVVEAAEEIPEDYGYLVEQMRQGRGRGRLKTASCWRNPRISRRRSWRERRKPRR